MPTDNATQSTPFEIAIGWIRIAEGIKTVNDTADHGGETRFGISKAAHPEAWADGPPSWARAQQIYKRVYWDGRGCSKLPLWAALSVFDGEVQHHPHTATRMMQDCLGVTADGVIGPKTAAAARDAAPWQIVLDRYLVRRAHLYSDIRTADSSQAKFLDGWFWRLFRLQRFILAEVGQWEPYQ